MAYARGMRVAFRLVDVFTDRPFAGNQLCVIPDPQTLDADAMQVLAREIGFSETTFVTEAAAGRYAMRIFTPDEELPFAGHPTLGTAFVLAQEGRIESNAVQRTHAGEVPVEVDLARSSARMRQLPPTFGPAFEDREVLAAAASLSVDELDPELPARVVATGLGSLMVPVRDPAALRRAERDARGVRAATEASGGEALYLFAVEGPGRVTARMFDPGVGIGEDPATGSAAGPLGAYLAEHGLAGMPGGVVIRQGEQVGRPSELRVDVARDGASWVIHVEGGVRIVGDGGFEL